MAASEDYDKKLASIIDHTILPPDATREDVEEQSRIAHRYGFASIIVNSYNVAIVAEVLKNSPVLTGSAIGFPFGAVSPLVKSLEARDAVAQGADELDMVINIGALKSGDYAVVEKEIYGVVRAADSRPVKVVIETAYLTDEEKITACRIAVETGASFVKTSSGYAPKGATVEDVRLMRKTVGPDIGVKAAGGIKSKEFALQLIEAGATRLGLSKSVELVTGLL
jgi:deoxyribose-phosphate aldolase